MAGIADLVGLDADEAGLDPGVEAAEILRRELAGLRAGAGAEGLLQQRPQEAQELGPAADLHLHQQGLALMDRHAAGHAHRLVAPGLGAAALVEGMARLMQHAHQPLDEFRLRCSGW